MKFYTFSTLLVVLLTMVPSSDATETFRKLSDVPTKGSKQSKSKGGEGKGKGKGGKGKGGDSQDHPSIEDPSYPMSMDIPMMSFSMDMSYPTTKSAKSSKKSHSEKGTPPPKSQKKASKKSGGGKGKGSSGGDDSTHPAPSGSNDHPARPPSEIPPAPTKSPSAPSSPSSPTDTPVDPALQEVKLESYSISYTLSESVMPMREDYLQLEAVTDDYFNNVMLNAFEEPSGGGLVAFRTTLQTSEYKFGEPVVVVYDSTAYFSEDFPSSQLPAPSTIETLLALDLEDPTNYLDALMGLGPENAFYFTTSVTFTPPSTGNATFQGTNTQSGKSGASPATIAAGAVGAALLVAGVVLYRRRVADSEEDYYMQKNLNKPYSGGATIAGETFAGETCDGTASIGRSSQPSSQDEEKGMVNVDLDSPDHAAWDSLSTTARDQFERDDNDESDNSDDDNHDEDADSNQGRWGAAGFHDDSTLETFEANNSMSPPASQSPTPSMDENSTINDQDDNISTSLDAYPGAPSMSMDSQENGEHETGPLSVEEIEAMLVLNH